MTPMSSVVLGSVPLPASCLRGLNVKPRGCEQEVGMGCEVLTQTPIAGPGARDCELCRRGRELLALSWPSYKPEVHIGPAATLPAPAWQPSEPQSWSAPAVAAHCALTTRDSTLTTWPFSRSQYISLYTLLITSQQGPFLYYYWVCSHGPPLRSPGLDWMDRLSCHQLIVVTRSLRPAQQSPAVVAPCPRPQDSPRHRTTIQLLQWINFPKHWRFWGFRNTDMNTECCSRRSGNIALTILVVLILAGEISKEIKPLFSPIVQHQHQHSRDQAARASLPSVPWFLDSSWKVTQTWSNPPWTCERRINIPEASTI